MCEGVCIVGDQFVCGAIAVGYANGLEIVAFRPNDVMLAIANHYSGLR
jgi:hypothetical protein